MFWWLPDYSSSLRQPAVRQVFSDLFGCGHSTSPPTLDAKLAALKLYRRVMGLCYKCAAEWSEDHKCAPEVLPAIETVWESFVDPAGYSDTVEPVPSKDQLCLAISKAGTGSSPASRTVHSAVLFFTNQCWFLFIRVVQLHSLVMLLTPMNTDHIWSYQVNVVAKLLDFTGWSASLKL